MMEHLSHYALIFTPALVILLASVLKNKRVNTLRTLTLSVIVFFALFHLVPAHALSSNNSGHGLHSVADHPCCMPQTPSITPLVDHGGTPNPIASIERSTDPLIGFLAPKTFTTRSPPHTS